MFNSDKTKELCFFYWEELRFGNGLILIVTLIKGIEAALADKQESLLKTLYRALFEKA